MVTASGLKYFKPFCPNSPFCGSNPVNQPGAVNLGACLYKRHLDLQGISASIRTCELKRCCHSNFCSITPVSLRLEAVNVGTCMHKVGSEPVSWLDYFCHANSPGGPCRQGKLQQKAILADAQLVFCFCLLTLVAGKVTTVAAYLSTQRQSSKGYKLHYKHKLICVAPNMILHLA